MATAVVIIGRVIRTQTKTGTVPDLNQKSAIKIKATTGVARITARGNSKKSFTNEESPQKIPSRVPAITEIKNERKTLSSVYAKLSQNFWVLQSWIQTARNVLALQKSSFVRARTIHF